MRAKMLRRGCKPCARGPRPRRRTLGLRRRAARGNFLAQFGRAVTTDLFLAAAGVDPLVLAGAVPPGCLRGIDPAPIAAREGADTVLMLPTWTPRRPATHLLPSFAPLTEAPLAFRFEISALVDGEWSAWTGSATIGAADFAPLPAAAEPLACDVDVFRAARAVDAVRLRVRVRAAASTRWIVALSAADAVLGARICSPTSVAMVLGYWGRATAPAALAAEILHPALDIYGVWPAAVRAAAARGVAGYLLRFPDWGAVRWCLARGIPIVA